MSPRSLISNSIHSLNVLRWLDRSLVLLHRMEKDEFAAFCLLAVGALVICLHCFLLSSAAPTTDPVGIGAWQSWTVANTPIIEMDCFIRRYPGLCLPATEVDSGSCNGW